MVTKTRIRRIGRGLAKIILFFRWSDNPRLELWEQILEGVAIPYCALAALYLFLAMVNILIFSSFFSLFGWAFVLFSCIAVFIRLAHFSIRIATKISIIGKQVWERIPEGDDKQKRNSDSFLSDDDVLMEIVEEIPLQKQKRH